MKSFLSLDLEYPEFELQSISNFSLNVDCFEAHVGSQMKLDLKHLQKMSVYNVLRSPLCLAHPIVGSGLFDTQSKVNSIGFDINVSLASGGNLQEFRFSSQGGESKIGNSFTSIVSTGLYLIESITNSLNRIFVSILPGLCQEGAQMSFTSNKHSSMESPLNLYIACIIIFVAANLSFFVGCSRGSDQKLLKVARSR